MDYAALDSLKKPAAHFGGHGAALQSQPGRIPAPGGWPCPASGASCSFESTVVISGDDRVTRCSGCGLGVTLPMIDDLAALYSDRESWDFQPRSSTIALAIKRVAFRRSARSILRMVKPSPSVIVDYGCGSGLFTSCLQEISRAQVCALDFHDHAPIELNGPRYLPFSRAEELAGTADLLMASHVIEHENDPLALVEKMMEIVKPGGSIMLEVPNIDCWGASVFNAWWANWYLPYHRLHFSAASLRALVEAAGLEVLAERGTSVPSMGRTLASIFRRENHLGFVLAGALFHPLQWFLEKVTGRSSALRIVCRKP